MLVISYSSYYARFLQGSSFQFPTIHINVFSLCSILPWLQIIYLTCNTKALFSSNSPFKATSIYDGSTELMGFLYHPKENRWYRHLFLYEDVQKMKYPSGSQGILARGNCHISVFIYHTANRLQIPSTIEQGPYGKSLPYFVYDTPENIHSCMGTTRVLIGYNGVSKRYTFRKSKCEYLPYFY